jgi:hypothetical protein
MKDEEMRASSSRWVLRIMKSEREGEEGYPVSLLRERG